jgi:hypothetical protein
LTYVYRNEQNLFESFPNVEIAVINLVERDKIIVTVRIGPTNSVGGWIVLVAISAHVITHFLRGSLPSTFFFIRIWASLEAIFTILICAPLIGDCIMRARFGLIIVTNCITILFILYNLIFPEVITFWGVLNISFRKFSTLSIVDSIPFDDLILSYLSKL